MKSRCGPRLLPETAEAKVRLFRSLLRGREDIYARRFESRKTGKSGYAPACANEWVRGVCEKPRVKCAECPHRRFLALTDDVTRSHLSGFDIDGQPFVVGIYPLLPDETCWFLSIDFDKSGWREDAVACLETCRQLNLPASLERSRSGLGAHLWFLFEEPIPAALARRLGSHVLTETMERRPQLGLDSYAASFQKAPRDQGSSLFLDDILEPWADRWAYLAGLRRLRRYQVERTVQEAERQGRVLGVRLPPQEEDENEPWAAPPSRRPRMMAIAGELPKAIELVALPIRATLLGCSVRLWVPVRLLGDASARPASIRPLQPRSRNAQVNSAAETSGAIVRT